MTDYKSLIDDAIRARELSYSPYSLFKVGAALLSSDGTVYTGTNIENASFGETVCAERVAIFKAVAEGKRSFSAIAIVGGHGKITDYTFPCGGCRQVMSEFCSHDLKIILFNGKEMQIHTLGQLFPSVFSKESLK